MFPVGNVYLEGIVGAVAFNRMGVRQGVCNLEQIQCYYSTLRRFSKWRRSFKMTRDFTRWRPFVKRMRFGKTDSDQREVINAKNYLTSYLCVHNKYIIVIYIEHIMSRGLTPQCPKNLPFPSCIVQISSSFYQG